MSNSYNRLKKALRGTAALIGASLVLASMSANAALQDQPLSTLTLENFRTETSGLSDGSSYNYQGFTWGSKWNGGAAGGNSFIHLSNNSSQSTLISRTDGSEFIFSGASFGWGSFDRNGAKVTVVLYDSNGQNLWQSDKENLRGNEFISLSSGYSGAVRFMAIGLDVNDPNQNSYKLQMDNFAYKATPIAAPASPSPVPEPTTEAMMAAGLLALAFKRRGSRAKTTEGIGA